MTVSYVGHSRLVLGRSSAWLIAVAGMLAIFATYWDEAWHTDVGRDTAVSAPHVLLYASVAVVGACVAVWGVRSLLESGSLGAVLRARPLLAAGLGGLGALVSAPIDALWHTSYGRDAVLWSPPHMLVVFAATGLALGVLSALPRDCRAVHVGVGALLLANAVAVVFEYEADVPQFDERFYLPVLLVAALPVAAVVRERVPGRLPVTRVVLAYVALRLCVSAELLILGRSTPDLPVAVLGLAVFDVPSRNRMPPWALAAGATAALAWLASGIGWASIAASAVGVVALPVICVAAVLLVRGHRLSTVVTAAAVLLATSALVAGRPVPALAHDPGQGDNVMTIKLRVVATRGGLLTVSAEAPTRCASLVPVRLLARRAGETRVGVLRTTQQCAFEGVVRAPLAGRWFVYSEFEVAGERTEAWLPVNSAPASSVSATRELYRPAGAGDGTSFAQYLLGALIYATGIGLLAIGVLATRTRQLTQTL